MDDLNLLDIEVRIPVCRVAQRSGCILSAVWLKGESIRIVLGLVGHGLRRGLVRRDVEDAVPYRILGGGRLRRGLVCRGDGPLRLFRQGKGSGGEAQDHQQGQDKAQCAFDGFHDGSSIKNNCVRVNHFDGEARDFDEQDWFCTVGQKEIDLYMVRFAYLYKSNISVSK